MHKISPFVDNLIEAFQCLPGVGPKSARRMVLHLLEKDREAGSVLAESFFFKRNRSRSDGVFLQELTF